MATTLYDKGGVAVYRVGKPKRKFGFIVAIGSEQRELSPDEFCDLSHELYKAMNYGLGFPDTNDNNGSK